MKIEWNKVTWYSKLLSAIFLLLILPMLTFFIGFKFGELDKNIKEQERNFNISDQKNLKKEKLVNSNIKDETVVNYNKNFIKPSTEIIKKNLTPIQFEVTQNEGTEAPYKNEYFDNHEEGIYVDIVSGEPLFSSKDKYDSGTGWPSFTKPIDKNFVKEKTDIKLIFPRTEVRSVKGDSHLGHVFDDGPAPLFKRYCMNSASLRFIPKEKMVESGYEEYVKYI